MQKSSWECRSSCMSSRTTYLSKQTHCVPVASQGCSYFSTEWLKTNTILKKVHGFDCSEQYTVIFSATLQRFPRANTDTLQKTSIMLCYLVLLRLQICFNLFCGFTWVPLILLLACGNNRLTGFNHGFWGKPVKFGFKWLYRLFPNAQRRFALRNITGQRLKLESPINSLWLKLWSRVIIVNYN